MPYADKQDPRRKQSTARYRNKNRQKLRSDAKDYVQRNYLKTRQATDKQRQKQRLKIFDVYGYKCSCCGETNKDFLTIDHINGGGCKEKRDFGSSYSMYKHAIEVRDFNKYQILCFNCNMGKNTNKGICPHIQPRVWLLKGEKELI